MGPGSANNPRAMGPSERRPGVGTGSQVSVKGVSQTGVQDLILEIMKPQRLKTIKIIFCMVKTFSFYRNGVAILWERIQISQPLWAMALAPGIVCFLFHLSSATPGSG